MRRCFFLILILQPFCSLGQIRLPSVLSDNMVLQQQESVRLWGWCSPAEKISVETSWNHEVDSVTGSRDATWQLYVQTPAAGGPFTITLHGKNEVTIHNVMIGEVWICSGQSNMELNEQKRGLQDIKAEFPTCYNNDIRFFYVPKTTSAYPQDNCAGSWTVCDSNTLKTFSAAGYFFGKKLNKTLKVPVGLINANWGGTAAEVWVPADLIQKDSSLEESAKKVPPSRWWPFSPGVAFNGMIAPLSNFNIAGVIWYQGESNTVAPETYHKLFTLMIDAWRKDWNKDFPFYYVQIAPYRYKNKNVGALIQEAQAKSAGHLNVGMVVITDLVNDTNNIHPTDKHDVGYRLANWALAKTYHVPGLSYRSPLYSKLVVKNNKAYIYFDSVKTGLQVRGEQISELFISGIDRVFHPATGTIDGNVLIVESPRVKSPVAVRYSFGNTSIGNLFTSEGLPVTPFRTDSWPVDTLASPDTRHISFRPEPVDKPVNGLRDVGGSSPEAFAPESAVTNRTMRLAWTECWLTQYMNRQSKIAGCVSTLSRLNLL